MATINGTSGDDHINGTNDNDVINGGAGDDVIFAKKGNDIVHGGDGNDTINGDQGDDILYGDDGNDFLYGNDGNDILIGGAGYDLLDGGDGIDTARYSGSIFDYTIVHYGTSAIVAANGPGGPGTGAEGIDGLVNIERIQFADVTIDLTANNAPIARDDVASVGEDAGSLTSSAPGVLGNDYDFDGDTLHAVAGTFTGTYGTLTLNANGSYTYVLNASVQALAQGESVVDSFDYTVTDGSLSDTGTLRITINGANDAPVANPDTGTTGENQVLTVSVLANDTDVDHNAILSLVSAAAPSGKGTASVVGNQVQFNPGTDFDHLALGATETVVVNYTMKDEFGATSSSTLTITVTGTNDAPVAVADTAATAENAPVTINVLANDHDVDDGAVLTVTAASAPAGQGTASVVGNQVQFNPGTDFDHLAEGATQVVTVSYTIADQYGATSTSTISVTVTGTNDAPIAVADTASTTENAPVTINVLANDHDVDDGATLTVTAASAPAGKGTASVVGNQVQFNPGTDFDHLAQGATQVVNVSYTISDEHGATSTSTVAVTVTGTNDAPVAVADTATTSENAPVTINVLANDHDVDDGAMLTVTAASAPSGQGSASVVANQVQFNPGTDFDHLAVGESQVVNLSYTIADEHGATSTSTIAVTVTGTNDAPVIDAGNTTASGSVTELPNNDPGENVTVHHADGSVAFTDADTSDLHTATATPQGAGYLGSFTLDPVNDGTDNVAWHFSVSDAALDSLGAGDTLTQTYTVEISDGHGGFADQNVTITIHGASDSTPPDGTNWYIDNSAVGSANTGSPSDPFTSIAAFNAAQGTPGGPGVGDNVFLLAGTGTGIYAEADGINLLDGQILAGVANGAVRPLIVATGGDGVDLAQNNTISGIDIGNTSGAGISDSGGTVGTATITDVGKSGAGQVIDIDQGGTIHVTLNSAGSTSSAGGAIDLENVSGDFTVTGAANIAGATGNGVNVIGDTGLAVAFQGGLTASTGASDAVHFSGNGATTSLVIAGLNLTTTSGTGLLASNGGTVTVTGSGNTITSGAGSAVNVSHSTIGTGGVTLQSVTSTGGSADGIILDHAGSGGFHVTGIGSVDGSGGIISGKTGADGQTLQGVGIFIDTTSNVSLANMEIATNQNDGILGVNAADFTLTDSTIHLGNGTSASEGSVVFHGLTGTASFLGNVIGGGSGDNLLVTNSSGSLILNIADSASDQAMFGTTNNVTGNDSVHLETSGTAGLTATIDGVDFQGAREDLLEIKALGTSTQTLTIENNHFANTQNSESGAGGVLLDGGGAGTNLHVDFAVTGNTFTGADGSALAALYAQQAGDVRGYIANNVIGNPGDGVSGTEGSSGGGLGIFVALDKTAGTGNASLSVNIVDNGVYDVGSGIAGIGVRSNGGDATNHAVVEATLTGNNVGQLGQFATAGVYTLVGGTTLSGDFSKLGLVMDNNNIDASGAGYGDNAVLLDQVSSDAHYYFPGYAGSPDGEGYGGTASDDLDAFWTTTHHNIFTNGGYANFPGGVDAYFITGATGDALVHLPFHP